MKSVLLFPAAEAVLAFVHDLALARLGLREGLRNVRTSG